MRNVLRFKLPIIFVVTVLVALTTWKGIVVHQNALLLQKTFTNAWADTQRIYQERETLVDKLAAAASATPNFDQSALRALQTAKLDVDKASVESAAADPDQMADYDAKEAAFTKTIFHVIAVPMRHADIKVNNDFRNISSNLMNAQTNIGIVRNRYNEAVQAYDEIISGFPGALYAGVFRFKHSVPLPDQQPAGNAVVTTH
jgi:LemA protein